MNVEPATRIGTERNARPLADRAGGKPVPGSTRRRRLGRLAATFTGVGVTAAGGTVATVLGAGPASAAAVSTSSLSSAYSSHTLVVSSGTSSVGTLSDSYAAGVTLRTAPAATADPTALPRWTVGVGVRAPRAETGADL